MKTSTRQMHFMECILGKKEVLSSFYGNGSFTNLVDLNDGFGLYDMTLEIVYDVEELFNEGTKKAYPEFKMIDTSMDKCLRELSRGGPVGYIEMKYFRGQGQQAGIVYQDGEVKLGPLMTKTRWDESALDFIEKPEGIGAVNEVLHAVGVPERTDIDAFEQLELHRYGYKQRFLKL